MRKALRITSKLIKTAKYAGRTDIISDYTVEDGNPYISQESIIEELKKLKR